MFLNIFADFFSYFYFSFYAYFARLHTYSEGAFTSDRVCSANVPSPIFVCANAFR